jgi:outer membrane protein assembly factor BamB
MTRRTHWTILLLVAWVAVGVSLVNGEQRPAGDWPQFRGPMRDGVSQETGILDSWPEDGPRVLWRAPLGEGYSAISVVEGRLYTMYSDGDGEFVVCLDGATGRQLWRYRTDSEYRDRQGDGPRSTPTIDQGVVYALGAKGRLVALDAENGQQLWERDFKDDLEAQPPTWGVSTSPLVEGDLLLADIGGKAGRSVAAFDKRTGRVKWTSQSDIAGYSAPIAITVNGVRQVLFFTGTQLVSVAPASGRLYWRVGWRTSYDVNAATPVFIPPDKVFFSSGYDVGAAVLQIKTGGGRATVEEVWRSRVMKNQFSSSVLHDGHIYGFDDSTLKSIDALTGEERWRARGFGHGSLLYADGYLIVLGVRGKLALVEATPTAYRETVSAQVLEGKCWTVPTLAAGRLYLRNQKEILALDLAG